MNSEITPVTTANLSYVELNSQMNYKQIALTIFHEFALYQAAVIIGFEQVDDGSGDCIPKGDAVMQYLTYLDRATNFKENKRITKTFDKSNGVPLSHKLFRYSDVIVNNKPKWTIWRVQ